MEKICLSSSCRNLISPNSCLALYKHEVRESPISNQSRWLTFPANCARRADWRGGGLRGEHRHGGGADGLMCSCLRRLMPSPISCTTESCDLSHRKSPDTCRRKLYFNTTPLGLKTTLCPPVCYYYNLYIVIVTVKGSSTIKVKPMTVYFHINNYMSVLLLT